MKSAWQQYWMQGQITCFPTDSKFLARLSSFWLEKLALLELTGPQKLLEVGCGGGFLSRLVALHLAQQQIDVSCHFTDYIEKFDVSALALPDGLNYVFKSGVSVEDLPYADNEFDGYVSNFAFEYADLQIAFQELVRVLKPNGRFLLNCHAEVGRVTENNQAIVNALTLWLGDTLLDQHLTFLTSQTLADYDRTQYFAQVKQYVDRLAVLDKQTAGGISKSGLIEPLIQLFKITQQPRITLYQQLKNSYGSYVARLRHQLESGISAEKLRLLEQMAEDAQLKSFQIETFFDENDVVSILIVGQK